VDREQIQPGEVLLEKRQRRARPIANSNSALQKAQRGAPLFRVAQRKKPWQRQRDRPISGGDYLSSLASQKNEPITIDVAESLLLSQSLPHPEENTRRVGPTSSRGPRPISRCASAGQLAKALRPATAILAHKTLLQFLPVTTIRHLVECRIEPTKIMHFLFHSSFAN
jgi:hypothetical protein